MQLLHVQKNDDWNMIFFSALFLLFFSLGEFDAVMGWGLQN